MNSNISQLSNLSSLTKSILSRAIHNKKMKIPEKQSNKIDKTLKYKDTTYRTSSAGIKKYKKEA